MRFPLPARCAVLVLVLGALSAAGLTALPAASAQEPTRAPSPLGHIVVMGRRGATAQVAGDVRRLGGSVTSRLPIIGGVAAEVPRAALRRLAGAPGVVSIAPDTVGHLMSVDPSLGYDPTKDDGSMQLISQVVHAKDAWKKGYTGKGVDVALIDSGVSPVPGLASGNVVYGPDLSFDSQDPDLTNLDGFGHGTHMASIIAGRDFAGSPSQYGANTTKYLGMAPDARVVSVKVAASNGAADVSQVIAAINWVDQHAHTDGLNIRVLNLSYGTDSAQPYTVDPLAYAAEQAWKHGILVVVAGGNDGTSRNVLADPAYDPTLLAVGADDPHSSPSAGDDSVADFSSNGNSSRHVDVVAPGTHVLGLRDPGSDADNGNASAVVGNRFFRGSGTSQAAAVVSGAAALLIQRYPNATPDQIKSLLVSNAQTFKNGNAQTRGAGVINVDAAIGKPLPTSTGQGFASATGTGQLDPARGGLDVQDDNGNLLTGEQDIFGNAWNVSAWAAAVANQTTWGADGSWNGAVWTGTGFDGSTGSTWSGAAWTGVTWTGEAWSSHHWTSHHWTSDGWNGAAWTSDAWDSHHWTSENWSSFGWE